jgi:hypothetical protein
MGRFHPSSSIFLYFFKIILQKYRTFRKFCTFDIHSSWLTAVSALTVVAHGGMTHPAAVAHDSKFPHLYIRPKIARKCHNNSGKKKERVGKERGRE